MNVTTATPNATQASASSAPAPRTGVVLWGLVALYASVRFWPVITGKYPSFAVIALLIVIPAIFALFHGTVLHRRSGALAFILICWGIANVFENLSVATGFPFGRYYFTPIMGPKLFQIPILIGLAYIGMGYISWVLGRLILGGAATTLKGAQLVTVPLCAAFLMVAWNMSQDPVWSTVGHAWIWRDGGAYFGVPVSNFFGWYLLACTVYQAFALYLRGREPEPGPMPSGFWQTVLVFYLLFVLGGILPALAPGGSALVADEAGIVWRVGAITSSCALAAIFGMGPFAVLAWARLRWATRKDC
jgi:putative membrane protein